MPPDPPMSYTMNWNLNIEHSITPNLSVRVAYVGSRGLHVPDALDDANYTLPALTPVGYMWPCAPKDASGDCTMSGSKLNPNVGGIRANLWNNSSSYNGLQVGVTKNLSHGLQLSGGYTYQKCMDTGSNPTLSDPFENSLSDYMYFSKSLTRGLCDFNVGQAGVLSYLWNIPTPSGMKEWVSMLVGGWQFGGILTVQSGAPFSLVLGGDPLGRNAGDSGVSFPDRLSGMQPHHRKCEWLRQSELLFAAGGTRFVCRSVQLEPILRCDWRSACRYGLLRKSGRQQRTELARRTWARQPRPLAVQEHTPAEDFRDLQRATSVGNLQHSEPPELPAAAR